MSDDQLELPWIEPGCNLPAPSSACPTGSAAPGLLAAGADLSVKTLIHAYSQATFPWYTSGQPILWWSPDPRMVLVPEQFKISSSFQKTLKKFAKNPSCEIRINFAFEQVIQLCANTIRGKQSGTWIVPDMIKAYTRLHEAGLAHSVETWNAGELVGGLYCVALGRAVFGESMFSLQSDASKIALAGLVAFCKKNTIALIDCQQNTRHLASLGATEIQRSDFLKHISHSHLQTVPDWRFDPILWKEIV